MRAMFGIQKEHLDLIDDKAVKWNKNTSPLHERNWFLYNEEFWKEVGQEIGWAPFTIAMYFFKHKYG